MLQPICGYVLDVLGLKKGFAIFAVIWSLVNMAHGLAHNWQMLAALRGLLGLAEGSANPAGMKATSEWFPAKERGLAGGVYNIGASLGSMLAPPLVVWAILSYNWQTGDANLPDRKQPRGSAHASPTPAGVSVPFVTKIARGATSDVVECASTSSSSNLRGNWVAGFRRPPYFIMFPLTQ
jgi:MFS family permease